MLRKAKVVGKFVEFFGPGAEALPVVDRATIAQHGARIRRDDGLLPDRRGDGRLSARHRPQRRACAGLRELLQGAGAVGHSARRARSITASISNSISRRWCPASPGRSARRIASSCRDLKDTFTRALHQGAARGRLRQDRGRSGDASATCTSTAHARPAAPEPFSTDAKSQDRAHGGRRAAERRGDGHQSPDADARVEDTARDTAYQPADAQIGHGSVLIAAITSCTNTTNPSVMLAAGLLAKKAVERGLTRESRR